MKREYRETIRRKQGWKKAKEQGAKGGNVTGAGSKDPPPNRASLHAYKLKHFLPTEHSSIVGGFQQRSGGGGGCHMMSLHDVP